MSILLRSGLATIIVGFLAISGGAELGPASEEFRIDPSVSKILVHVGRSGLFAFAGHDHEVAVPAFTGRLRLDRTDLSQSELSVQFDATAMTVTGKGEPAKDVPEVQRVMLSERVLDVERYPKITFVSRRISIVEQSAGRVGARVDGELTLRGTTQSIIVPVDVQLSAVSITATGKAKVRQTLFGIRPVTAGARTVKVKDEVEIAFRVVARTAK